MVAAQDMTGHRKLKIKALPHEALKQLMKQYGR
jgi:hypothetical protein